MRRRRVLSPKSTYDLFFRFEKFERLDDCLIDLTIDSEYIIAQFIEPTDIHIRTYAKKGDTDILYISDGERNTGRELNSSLFHIQVENIQEHYSMSDNGPKSPIIRFKIIREEYTTNL